jgi:hypothetical protein
MDAQPACRGGLGADIRRVADLCTGCVSRARAAGSQLQARVAADRLLGKAAMADRRGSAEGRRHSSASAMTPDAVIPAHTEG